MPLKVVYVDDSRNQRNAVASYSFGSGTLQGHLLVQFWSSGLFIYFYSFRYYKWKLMVLCFGCDQAGEECFSITMDERNDVWYEILSFSKPANPLSFIGYPYVLLKQKHFARESTLAMQKHLSAKLDDNVSNAP